MTATATHKRESPNDASVARADMKLEVVAIPPVLGLRELDGLWTNREVSGMKTVPRRLRILGGGPVGVAMAQAVRRLGREVALVEGAALGEVLHRDGLELVTGTFRSTCCATRTRRSRPSRRSSPMRGVPHARRPWRAAHDQAQDVDTNSRRGDHARRHHTGSHLP